jgi:hypothetical protein
MPIRRPALRAGIAEGILPVSGAIRDKALGYLDGRLQAVVSQFTRRFIASRVCHYADESTKL